MGFVNGLGYVTFGLYAAKGSTFAYQVKTTCPFVAN
jgi:hypothetical protein